MARSTGLEPASGDLEHCCPSMGPRARIGFPDGCFPPLIAVLQTAAFMFRHRELAASRDLEPRTSRVRVERSSNRAKRR